MGIPELVSAAAAVVSAIGGTLATLAAFRSAETARVTQKAAAAAEHRAALRQIGTTATEILIELKRITTRGNDLKSGYRVLFTTAGQVGSSRKNLYDASVDEKLMLASQLADYAKLFTAANTKLDSTPPEETDRVHVRLSNILTEVRALREDLERELSSVEAQSAVFGDMVKGLV